MVSDVNIKDYNEKTMLMHAKENLSVEVFEKTIQLLLSQPNIKINDEHINNLWFKIKKLDQKGFVLSKIFYFILCKIVWYLFLCEIFYFVLFYLKLCFLFV